MRIDEVTKGTEYGLKQDHGDPRRVQAMKVVTIPERVYNHALEKWLMRDVRKIEVKYLDTAKRRFEPNKGARGNVQARDLIAPWTEIGPNLRARLEEEEAKRTLEAEIEKRMKKILGRNYDGYVHVRSGSFSLRVDGKSAVKMLELAEKGAAK